MNMAGDNNMVRCRGFTLIEILLAMLITSILILGVNIAYRQAYLVWSNAEDKRPIYHACRLITETLRQEVSCLYFPPTIDEEDSDGPFKLSYLPDGGTELIFYTLTPSWKGSLGSSRVAKVSYRFSKDPDTKETSLERFERLCSGERIIGKESSDLVVKGLSDFRVWVADPNSGPRENSRRGSYGSKDIPPKALKVLLRWAGMESAPAVDFEASILIACQGSLGHISGK